MLKKPFICILDDHAEVRESLADALNRDLYDFVLLEKGTQLLNYEGEQLPDVILLDVMMPELDGFTICKRLKTDEKWRHIPIILVTSLNTRDYLVRGLEAGAEDFLVKPVHRLELRARVRSMLRIKQQYDELQEVLDLREKLSNLVVHDLRQPVGAALIRSFLMLQRRQLTEKDEVDLQIIQNQLRRPESLANDILMAAKMHAGKFVINPQPVDLKQLINKVYSEYEISARALNITLSCDLPDEDCLLSLDANLMIRLLENLLSNAMKFSASDDLIIIRLTYPPEPDAPEAKLEVLDTGPGVPPEYREKIFEEYEVLSIRENNGPQVGLGLAFCKIAVEAHNGRIYVTDNIPQGAIFTVEL
jgi:signal transduction histidine kinase